MQYLSLDKVIAVDVESNEEYLPSSIFIRLNIHPQPSNFMASPLA